MYKKKEKSKKKGKFILYLGKMKEKNEEKHMKRRKNVE